MVHVTKETVNLKRVACNNHIMCTCTNGPNHTNITVDQPAGTGFSYADKKGALCSDTMLGTFCLLPHLLFRDVF